MIQNTLDIKKIIKLLPFEESFKLQLLEKLDTFSPDQKFEAEQLLWEAYAAYLDIEEQKNLHIGFEEVRQGKRQLTNHFAQQIRSETDKELDSSMVSTATAVDLSGTRQKLEEIMQGDSK